MMHNEDSVRSSRQVDAASGELTPSKRVTFKDAFNDAAASDSVRSSPSDPAFTNAAESTSFRAQPDAVGRKFSEDTPLETIFEPHHHHHHHHPPAACHSMPAALVELQEELARRDLVMMEKTATIATNRLSSLPTSSPSAALKPPKPAMFHSQPIPGVRFLDSVGSGRRIPRNNKLQDRRYQSFKTWSGALEKHISTLRGRPREPEEEEEDGSHNLITQDLMATPKVDRYYESLKGPELDTLRSSEELVLPEDKWPFLLRFPISAFGMCLGVGSQAMLYKNLATSSSTEFLHISPAINFALWCISLALMSTVVAIYALKVVFYFEAVRREYYHPIRVNFFFAPWIACLFLAIGLPPKIAAQLPAPLWYVLMIPFMCLELKIYGQWMSGGQRRLSKVANPSNHLSVVGNFVGALLGASMGLKEGPVFFFAVGMAHYTVLFVTLYQRLPTNDTLPKELHPVFFLFVAAPSVASMAWAKITGEFGYLSRIAYFIAIFLYASLVVRLNFFRGFKFSLAWWAYTFPMTGAAIATIRYSSEVNNIFTKSLAVLLSTISTLTVLTVFASTIIHAFVLRDLFPNDVVIAIAPKRIESMKLPDHLPPLSMSSSDMDDEERQVNGGEGSDAGENDAPIFDVPRR